MLTKSYKGGMGGATPPFFNEFQQNLANFNIFQQALTNSNKLQQNSLNLNESQNKNQQIPTNFKKCQ